MLYSYPVKVNEMFAKDKQPGLVARIAVIFPGALGDFVCFLPALHVLAAAAEVELFARTEFADIVPQNVTVRPYECDGIARLFVPGGAKEEQTRRFFGDYSVIYSWHGSQNREFVEALRWITEGRARLFAFHSVGPGMHQSDYYLSCIGNLNPGVIIPLISLRPQAKVWRDQYWATHGLIAKPVLTLAPGSGALEKNWPAQFFQAVARWWRKEIQGAVIALFGPVEEERGVGDLTEDCDVVARNLNLTQVTALLSRTDLYLGNDSGITHLSAAVGARTFALFGPSAVCQWEPRGKRVSILKRNVQCSPCSVPGMRSCLHRVCLNGLPVKEVVSELANAARSANLTREGAGIKV